MLSRFEHRGRRSKAEAARQQGESGRWGRQMRDAQVDRLKTHMTEKSRGSTDSWLWGPRGREELMVTVGQASFLADGELLKSKTMTGRKAGYGED